MEGKKGEKPHVNILTGPTGVGKTRYALRLARKWKTEIISVDSMQVYRQLSIGTDKPDPRETGGIPYHLTNCLDIDKKYDLARFIREADELVERLSRENKTPLLVGGTGLYIRGFLEGIFDLDGEIDAGADPRLRSNLYKRLKNDGIGPLYEELRRVDPPAASRIKPGDSQRIIRALEVFQATGIPISRHQEKSRRDSPRYPHTLLVMTRKREELYSRIEDRVERMFQKGLVSEVKSILDAGYSPSLHPLKALGYREVIQALQGHWSMERAKEEMKKASRRYAKRQLTWFRGMPRAVWLDITGLDETRILENMERLLLQGSM